MNTIDLRPIETNGRKTLIYRHLVLGWSMLLVFLILGLVLEIFHGLKIEWYLDTANATRRLMWTLAHAHGVLLGLLSIAFAATLASRPVPLRGATMVSACLVASSVLLPGGFLLGGIVVYGGDPGFGIFLSPIGSVLLLVAVARTLLALRN